MGLNDSISRLIAIAERQAELVRLATTGRLRVRPSEPNIVEINQDNAIWEIRCPHAPVRFMCVSKMESRNFVVMVDAEAFYRVWLRSSPPMMPESFPRPRACLIRARMPADYKYARAVAGFSAADRHNPVPLALCDVTRNRSGRVKIGFTNGVTRTLWLLYNRVPAFPLMVEDDQQANLLYECAGLAIRPQSIRELFVDTDVLATLSLFAVTVTASLQAGDAYPVLMAEDNEFAIQVCTGASFQERRIRRLIHVSLGNAVMTGVTGVEQKLWQSEFMEITIRLSHAWQITALLKLISDAVGNNVRMTHPIVAGKLMDALGGQVSAIRGQE